MWKGRPVVASRVGGIRDQVVDGVSGLLLDDPRDVAGMGALLQRVLDDPELATSLGRAGRERVKDQFLGDRHLLQYGRLIEGLLPAWPPPHPVTPLPRLPRSLTMGSTAGRGREPR
jgi:trehalose synthase